jgi:hypothetical protein
MSSEVEPESKPQLTMTFELVAEGSYEEDLAMVAALGREVVNDLQKQGALVQPIISGQRGGDFLVQVVTTLQAEISHLAGEAWAHKDELLSDSSSLVTICTPIAALLHFVLLRHRRRSQQPIKLSMEIDGAPVTIEAADIEQAEAGLQLAQRFSQHHPGVAKKVIPQSKVKIKGSIAPQPRRRRK